MTTRFSLNIEVLILSIVTGFLIFRFFSPSDVTAFGFTPVFTDIASKSAQMKSYVRTFSASDDSSQTKTVPEVQREPLYPFLLAVSNKIFGSYYSLVLVQLVAFIVFMYVMGAYVSSEFGVKTMVGMFVLTIMSPPIKLYVSTLYPYIFQMIFLGIGMITLSKGILEEKSVCFTISGLLFAVAIYERGLYLPLPVLIAGVLYLLTKLKKFKINTKHIIGYLLACYIVCIPYLVRKLGNGVVGMNQVTGYSLGYTYGSLPLPAHPSNDAFALKAYIDKFGTDAGSQYFIYDNTVKGNGSFADNDKKVALLMTAVMKENVGEVLQIIKQNILLFPARLVDPSGFIEGLVKSGKPLDYYAKYAGLTNIITIWDVLILITAIIGLILDIRKFKPFAIISAVFVVYMLIVVCSISIFDPRYRGLVDIIFFIYSAKFLTGRITQMIRTLGLMLW
jgi:hypothetical protein